MRLAGKVGREDHARLFSDILTVRKIEHDLSVTGDRQWEIWIHEEDLVEAGKELLEEFLKNPDDPGYRQEASGAGESKKGKTEKTQQEKQVYRCEDAGILPGPDPSRRTDDGPDHGFGRSDDRYRAR